MPSTSSSPRITPPSPISTRSSTSRPMARAAAPSRRTVPCAKPSPRSSARSPIPFRGIVASSISRRLGSTSTTTDTDRGQRRTEFSPFQQLRERTNFPAIHQRRIRQQSEFCAYEPDRPQHRRPGSRRIRHLPILPRSRPADHESAGLSGRTAAAAHAGLCSSQCHAPTTSAFASAVKPAARERLMPENAFLAYQTNSARGASPVGQVVALYDTILRDFRRAAAALDAGNVEGRVFELNHALTVIGHLRSVLDHQRGGEAARRLERFYDVTQSMIVQANLSPSREAIQRLADLYSTVRQAWQEAERQLASFSAENTADRSPAQKMEQPAQTPAAETTAPASGRWSA